MLMLDKAGKELIAMGVLPPHTLFIRDSKRTKQSHDVCKLKSTRRVWNAPVLRRHECDEGQSYYFSHPVGADQAGHLLETGIKQESVQMIELHRS